MRISNKDFFSKLRWAESENLPLTAFKLPNSQQIHLIYQNNSDLHKVEDFSQEGFVINSFSEYNPYIIKPENHFESEVNTDTSLQDIPFDDTLVFDQQSYMTLVQQAINEIHNTKLKKVVTSQRVTKTINQTSVADYFEALIQRFASAFCYVLFHPKLGKWMAATPEILLKINENHFETMSLAGTQLFVHNQLPTWTEKEKEEQKIVTDTIIEKLAPLSTELSVWQTQTIRAGNLWHLCTKISGKFTHQNTTGNLIKALHPTPAVCGYPVQNAKNFINTKENYNREFYTGFCGVLNLPLKGKSDIFVNLRCMQITNNQSHIYVGGGITKDSDPLQEFQEIRNKAQNMLQIIKHVNSSKKIDI